MRVLADRLRDQVDRLDRVESLDQATELSTKLPTSVTEALSTLATGEGEIPAVLLSGNDLGPVVSVPTPRSFGEHESLTGTADGMIYLLGALIGSPYCFASQQRGSLVLDVIPLRGCEEDQLGCSSTVALEWHNEDAFHPLRADFVILMCIRNDQQAATRLVFVDDVELEADVLDQLRQPQFTILPDVSHSYDYNLATSGIVDGSEEVFAGIARTQREPARAAVLTEDSRQICVDFAYMPAELQSDAANAALRALRTAVERAGRSVALAEGDVLIFDNRRCLHGRDSFGARYDGADRWLRRLNVSRERSRVTEHGLEPGTLRIS